MGVTAFITVNFFLFISWHMMLFSKREQFSFADRAIGTVMLALSQIILTQMLLGIVLKQLFAGPLFAINLSISLLLLISVFFTGGCSNEGNRRLYFSSAIDEIKEKTSGLLHILRRDPFLIFLMSLFVLLVCRAIFMGYLFPPYTWDALWYHLPIVGYIIQSGAIQEVPNYFFISQFINIFPKNIELYFLWNIVFLKSDIITDLSQLLFAVTGIFTVYSLAVKLQIRRKYARYSAILFFFTPIVVLQTRTNYTDIAVAVLFLAAINFVIHSPVPASYSGPGTELKRRKLSLFMAGVITGILLGSKGSGPLFVVILSSAILVQEAFTVIGPIREVMARIKQRIPKGFVLYIVFFLLPVICLGGYWYIKNWIIYGNPVYPIEISVMGTTIFKGLFKEFTDPAPDVIEKLGYWKKLLYVWKENVGYYLYDSRLSGLGPVWFILFLPAVLFAFVYSAAKKKSPFLFVGIILLLTFLIYPRNWNTRYVLFVTGLGALSFGMTFEMFYRKERILKTVAALLVFYTFLTSNSPSVTPAQAEKFLQLPPSERTIARHAPFNIDIHVRKEYGYWIWISDNISQGDTLAYTFEPKFLSPLWNSSFTSSIAYVKADTYREWTEELVNKDATFVVVKKTSQEDKWIEKERSLFGGTGDMKGKFSIVYMDDNFRIVRINRI